MPESTSPATVGPAAASGPTGPNEAAQAVEEPRRRFVPTAPTGMHRLGKALMLGQYPNINRLRRDTHEESAGCWLHAPRFCLAA